MEKITLLEIATQLLSEDINKSIDHMNLMLDQDTSSPTKIQSSFLQLLITKGILIMNLRLSIRGVIIILFLLSSSLWAATNFEAFRVFALAIASVAG